MRKALAIARRVFLRMSVREKLLALLFILVMLFLWTNSLLQRGSQWKSDFASAGNGLSIQQQWLDIEDRTAMDLEAALERVEPSKTFSASQLAGRIDDIVRQVGLAAKAEINPVKTREGEIFDDHNIRVRLRRIDISQVIDFNSRIRDESPYINIEKITLTPVRNKEAEIDARFEINSFELKRQ